MGVVGTPMSGSLSFPPPPKRKPRVIKYFGRKPTPLKRGEKKVERWDVYRIVDGTRHVCVYRDYSSFDGALQARDNLHIKTGDKCYVVGRSIRMVTKLGT